MKIDLKRVIASKEGAYILVGAYIGLLLLLALFGLSLQELPVWIGFFVAPAAGIINFSASNSSITGMPPTMVLANIAIYALVGYMIDWIHKPKV